MQWRRGVWYSEILESEDNTVKEFDFKENFELIPELNLKGDWKSHIGDVEEGRAMQRECVKPLWQE